MYSKPSFFFFLINQVAISHSSLSHGSRYIACEQDVDNLEDTLLRSCAVLKSRARSKKAKGEEVIEENKEKMRFSRFPEN